MKQYAFSINGHDVTVEALQALGKEGIPIEAVDFTARCGEKIKTSRLSMHPKANKTVAQTEKNIAAEAERLAHLIAGHRQSGLILEGIFKKSQT